MPSTHQRKPVREVLERLLERNARNRFVYATGACFAASTLVHTKEGLKPIQQIKVGDCVLSRPESPDHGTQTGYKRVVRTIVHHNKPVIFGSFNRPPPPENRYKFGKVEQIIMTPDHPFWVQGRGWTASSLLRTELLLHHPRFLNFQGETLNGGYWRQVLTTKNPDRGWFPYVGPLRDGDGCTYDMLSMEKLPDVPGWDMYEEFSCEEPWPPEEFLDFDNKIHRKYIYHTTVFNFEVEEWHTYFVGELGVWVHNAPSVLNPTPPQTATPATPTSPPRSSPAHRGASKSTPSPPLRRTVVGRAKCR
jgi:hypothetical protein